MTDAQEDILDRVRQILDEHFEGWVLVVRAERDDHRDDHKAMFTGGFVHALGLLNYGEDLMKESQRSKYDDEGC